MGKPFGVRVSGPLVPFVGGFLEELARQRYSPWSATSYLFVMRHLSLWLGDHGWTLLELTPQRLQVFVADRRAQGYAKGHSPDGMVGVLTAYLRGIGAMPPDCSPIPDTLAGRILQEFATYLTNERGLAKGTIHCYQYFAQLFLSFCGLSEGEVGYDLGELSPSRVSAFVLAESRYRSSGSLSNLVTALRALVTFLYLQGYVPIWLAAAVPSTPAWRDNGARRALDGRQVSRLLASCNRQSASGLRDFAILTMLARLGLRSQEVALLRLDDVDWRNGEVRVAGKGSRHDQLPLPVDVGKAVANYCRYGRPHGSCRALFLHVRAPYAGLAAASVSNIVGRACRRAGVPPVGAHRLRHAAATAMRQAGAPLSEIGQVLRHRHPVTTALYAKDDLTALATIARRWPGGAA